MSGKRKSARYFTHDDVLDLIRQQIKREFGDEWGAQEAWSQKHDLYPQVVSDIMHKRRPISGEICRMLRLRKVKLFVKDDRKL